MDSYENMLNFIINLGNIKKIVPDDEKTTIQFLNDEQITVDVTYNIIRNQYFKSLSLDNSITASPIVIRSTFSIINL